MTVTENEVAILDKVAATDLRIGGREIERGRERDDAGSVFVVRIGWRALDCFKTGLLVRGSSKTTTLTGRGHCEMPVVMLTSENSTMAKSMVKERRKT